MDFSYCKDPHVVSNVLKLYLRELPNPLMTAEMYPKFIEAQCALHHHLLYSLTFPNSWYTRADSREDTNIDMEFANRAQKHAPIPHAVFERRCFSFSGMP